MARKKHVTVEQIDANLARWQTRLKRAVNTIERLQKLRRRVVKAASVAPKARPASLAETILREIAEPPKVMAAEATAESVERLAPEGRYIPAALDTAIPDFLKAGKGDPIAEQIRAEQAETKRKKAAGRIAKMKAKQSGETKKMPLTGRAALDAIRNG